MTKELELKIGEKIKELRKQHKLSQEELAERLGVTRQSIISIEQDKYLPSLPIAVSICDVFDSAFDEIFAIGHEISKNIERELNSSLINKEAKMPSEMEPWKPFREMVSLRDAMDRLFEDSVVTPKFSNAGMPKIDMRETKGSVVVKAELPGIAEEEIDVEILDNIMTISGEKKSDVEEEKEGYFYKESHTGTFSRSFTLPSEVKAEKAEAEMKNGILTITIPKVEAKKAKKVAIKAKIKK